MKRAFFLGILSLLISTAAMAQKAEVKAVKSTIEMFAAAGDAQDADKLGHCLDANYRVVMNQLFGSTEVSVMPREAYLEAIRSKKFGGDTRALTFADVQINGNTAYAKVELKGKKMTATSIFTLVQNAKGKWLLVSDVPVIAG